jgi:hypothetical protein
MPQDPGNGSPVNGSPSIAGATSPQPSLSIDRSPPRGPSARSGATPDSPFQGVHDNMKQAQAAYKQGTRAQEVLDHVRQELDDLMDMGDAIRPEDVITSAGTLVSKGLGAQQLAELLSTMPTMGGQGLASWVRMHDLTIRNAEAQLAQENNLTRHQMTVAAFKSLAAHHIEQKTDERTAIQSHMAAQANALGGNTAMPPVSVMQVEQPEGSAGPGEGLS